MFKNFDKLLPIIILYFCTVKSIYLGFILLCFYVTFLSIFQKKVWDVNLLPILPFISLNILLLIFGVISIKAPFPSVKDILRDVVNFIFPSLALLAGYFSFISYDYLVAPKCNRTFGENLLLRSIALCGVISILIQVYELMAHTATIKMDTLRTYRETVGTGFDATLFALLLFFLVFQDIPKNKIYRDFFWLLCLISVFVSFSRINFVVLIVSTITMLLFSKKVKLKSVVVAIIILMILFWVIPSGIRETFLLKTSNSFSEIRSNSNNFVTWADINNNWRGYEKYTVKSVMENAGIGRMLTGFGLGARLPLPFSINLGGSLLSAIPTIHTSYYYVFFKCGYLGLVCYLGMLITILKNGIKSHSSIVRNVLIILFILVSLKGYTEGGIIGSQTSLLVMFTYGVFLHRTTAKRNGFS